MNREIKEIYKMAADQKIIRAVIVLGALFGAVSMNSRGLQSGEFIASAATGDQHALRLLSRLGGGASAVFIDGNNLFYNEYNRLVIADITIPSAPVRLGSIDLPNPATDIFVSGEMGYVATETGLDMVDISNPNEPVVAGSYTEPGISYAVFVTQQVAYLAAMNSLEILDVSNPAHPTILGVIDLHPGDGVSGVWVKDSIAYLGTTLGLRIFDVTDPSAAHEIAQLELPDLTGNLYLSGDTLYATGFLNYFYMIDVGDPYHPVELGFAPNLSGILTMDIVVNNNLAYVANQYEFLIFDVSDKPHPILVGGAVIADGKGVAYRGSYAYLADDGSGLLIYDVSDPQLPLQLESLPAKVTPYEIFIGGNTAYVSDWMHLVCIIDISQPERPSVTSCLPSEHAPGRIFVQGDTAYICYGSELDMVDVGDKAHPRFLDNYYLPLGSANDVVVNEDIAYLAGTAGLWLLDVHDHSNVQVISNLNTHSTYRLAVSGGIAYLVADFNLWVVDVHDASNPKELTYEDTLLGSDIFLRGKIAYIPFSFSSMGGADGWLSVVDISDPSQPTEIGRVDHLYDANNVTVTENLAIVGHNLGGLNIVDVSDPKTPYETASYTYYPGNAASMVSADGNRIFVAAGSAGFISLEYGSFTYFPLIRSE